MQTLLEPVLSLVDWMLRIRRHKEATYALPPASPGVPDATKDLYREALAEMRIRRDTEFKIVALHLQVCAFLFAASVVAILHQQAKPNQATVIGLGAAVILIALWLHVHARIAYDNSSYVYYRNIRDSIEVQWFGITQSSWFRAHGALPPPGFGYRRTQGMVALCTMLVVCILGLLVYVTWQQITVPTILTAPPGATGQNPKL
jgi:hypothetical protein